MIIPSTGALYINPTDTLFYKLISIFFFHDFCIAMQSSPLLYVVMLSYRIALSNRVLISLECKEKNSKAKSGGNGVNIINN